MLKEIKRDGNRIYYTDKDGVIFYVWDWYNKLTIEKVVEAYKSSSLPSYVPLKFSELHKKPLGIYQLTIFEWGSELKPMNMNLWEYETFIKGNNKANKKFKSAFINYNLEDNYLYIAIENFDSESTITRKSLQDIEKYVAEHEKEICKIFDVDYLGFEVYSYPE